jgi:hypothetical protein
MSAPRTATVGLLAALVLAPLGGCRLAKPVGAAPVALGPGPGVVSEDGSGAAAGAPVDDAQPMRDPARRAGLPLVFVTMPRAASFQATRRALVTELSKAYDVSTFVVAPETAVADLGVALEHAKPACVVLMNNTSVRLYRDYQRAHRGEKFPPAVVVMTSFFEDMRHDLKGVTGIAYEVPAVTALVGLRAAIEAPITRVGVLHGTYSRDFVERQRRLAAQEHFEIVPIEVRGADPSLRDVRAALRALKHAHHVDALWILNDNKLLKDGRFLLDAWTPALEMLGVPVVVGAEPLVNAQASFGTFGVLPDHAALGVQAANLILDLADDGWRTDEHAIELPLSTITVLDVEQARSRFGLRAGALDHIDRPVR